jgi:hypothetical protein
MQSQDNAKKTGDCRSFGIRYVWHVWIFWLFYIVLYSFSVVLNLCVFMLLLTRQNSLSRRMMLFHWIPLLLVARWIHIPVVSTKKLWVWTYKSPNIGVKNFSPVGPIAGFHKSLNVDHCIFYLKMSSKKTSYSMFRAKSGRLMIKLGTSPPMMKSVWSHLNEYERERLFNTVLK